MRAEAGTVILDDSDLAVLDEDDFGVPGLVAQEWIGPFVRFRQAGPLIMVHDGVFDPHRGIGHHPHRSNERLFYILEGEVDHDDALNRIQGHMGTGDLGRLTEGRIGMFHKEWNNSDGRARAFILVYATDPVPARAAFTALRDLDATRYEPAPGVRTKELVGSTSAFALSGDVRFFSDDEMDEGAELPFELGAGEGGLVFPVDGQVRLDGSQELAPGSMAVLEAAATARTRALRASTRARLLRVGFGGGEGMWVVRDGRVR